MATVDREPDPDVTDEQGPEWQSGRPLELSESVDPVPIGAGWDAEPVVLDWFGEGRPDLLISFGGGPFGRFARVYRPLEPTDERPARYDAGQDVEGLEGLRGLCPIPNDRPTRFDLVALAPEGLVLLRNEGTADSPRFGTQEVLGLPADLGIGPGRVAQMVADDWDGDGKVDLLVGFDSMEGYWPSDEAVPPAQRIGFNQSGGHPGYDRHGKWRGEPPRGRLFWLRNVGEPGRPSFEAPEEIGAEGGSLELGLHPAPLSVSWGGGRSWEMLLTDDSGLVRLHRNFGGQRPPVLMEPRPITAGGQALILPPDRGVVSVADIDDDRRPELLFGRADGRVFAVHAGPGRDSARAPEPLLHEGRILQLGGHAVLSAADLDGDGDVDLVAGDGTGRLVMVEDQGTDGRHDYAAPVEIEALGLPFRMDPGPDGMLDGPVGRRLGFACPTIVDWKTNGRPDLIVAGAGGDVLYFRNNGGVHQPRFDRPEPLRCAGAPLITPPRVRPAAVDWEGSGLPDLISLDLQGLLCVYPRQDVTELAAPTPLVDRLGRVLRLDGAFGQAGRCALWAGPWTGSGRPDILVGLPRSNRHVVPALTGTPLEHVDDLPTVLLLENLGNGVLVPRPVRQADGRPLVVGFQGCSPCGVDWRGTGELDLLVGSDDGRVYYFRRDDLSW